MIAAILSSEPIPITQLQPLTPPALDRVVRICLAKEPEDRWQNAHDLRLQLEWIRDAGSQAGVAPALAKHRINRERVAWTAAAFLVLIASLLSIKYLQPASPPAQQVTFAVEPPPGYKLPENPISALSPDGALLAYALQDPKGKMSIWIRPLAALSSRRVEGSESSSPYYSFVWTPDSGAIIAVLNGKLQRFSAAGGANEVLCDKFVGLPVSMNRNRVILASLVPPANIVSVSLEDCIPRPVFPGVEQRYDMGYAEPRFMPDGKHFLFGGLRKDKHHSLLLSSLEGGTPRELLRSATHPIYVSAGYILFSRDGYLMAQRFDLKSLSTSGEPILVYRKQLDFLAAFGWASFDASINSVISGKEQAAPPAVLRWYSRSGEVLRTVSEPGNRVNLRLSQQGTRAAVSLWDPRTHVSDMWSVDLERGSWRRETFYERPGGESTAWSPDGNQIIYSELTGANLEMFVKKTGSNDNGQMLQTGLTGTETIGDWSTDGKSIVYLFESETGDEVSVYGQLLSGGRPFFLARAGPEVEAPRLSPDARWIAYQSSESGSSEIYVRSFSPDPAASVQVSSGGGHDPRWSHAGNELFYRTNDSRIVSVTWRAGKHLEFSKPVTLFRLPENAEYDIVDGKRFLVNEPAGPVSGPLFVIVNWKPEPQNPN